MRNFTLLIAAAMLLGNVANKSKAPVTRYKCTRIERTASGEVWATVWASATRQPQSRVVLWIPGHRDSRVVRMTVRWQAIHPAPFDWNKGLVMLDREFDVNQSGNRKVPKRLSMELRANPNPPWEGYGAISHNFKLQFGVRLSADWGDVSAMSQGQRPLYLIVRSNKQVIETLTIPPEHLAPPIGRIEALLEAANADLANPNADPGRCEDLQNDEIVV